MMESSPTIHRGPWAATCCLRKTKLPLSLATLQKSPSGGVASGDAGMLWNVGWVEHVGFSVQEPADKTTLVHVSGPYGTVTKMIE